MTATRLELEGAKEPAWDRTACLEHVIADYRYDTSSSMGSTEPQGVFERTFLQPGEAAVSGYAFVTLLPVARAVQQEKTMLLQELHLGFLSDERIRDLRQDVKRERQTFIHDGWVARAKEADAVIAERVSWDHVQREMPELRKRGPAGNPIFPEQFLIIDRTRARYEHEPDAPIPETDSHFVLVYRTTEKEHVPNSKIKIDVPHSQYTLVDLEKVFRHDPESFRRQLLRYHTLTKQADLLHLLELYPALHRRAPSSIDMPRFMSERLTPEKETEELESLGTILIHFRQMGYVGYDQKLAVSGAWYKQVPGLQGDKEPDLLSYLHHWAACPGVTMPAEKALARQALQRREKLQPWLERVSTMRVQVDLLYPEYPWTYTASEFQRWLPYTRGEIKLSRRDRSGLKELLRQKEQFDEYLANVHISQQAADRLYALAKETEQRPDLLYTTTPAQENFEILLNIFELKRTGKIRRLSPGIGSAIRYMFSDITQEQWDSFAQLVQEEESSTPAQR